MWFGTVEWLWVFYLLIVVFQADFHMLRCINISQHTGGMSVSQKRLCSKKCKGIFHKITTYYDVTFAQYSPITPCLLLPVRYCGELNWPAWWKCFHRTGPLDQHLAKSDIVERRPAPEHNGPDAQYRTLQNALFVVPIKLQGGVFGTKYRTMHWNIYFLFFYHICSALNVSLSCTRLRREGRL